MPTEPYSSKIAYSCIFSRDVDEASANLTRLIAGGVCGFDEGLPAWVEALQEICETREELLELNRFGANFTAEQWAAILQETRRRLL
jgi:hypothetical protein